MVVNNLETEIKRITRGIDTAKEMLEIMDKIKSHKNVNKANYYSADYLRITVIKLSDLSAVRKMLRDVFGSWEDKIRNQFCSIGLFITTWACKEYPIEIWYECRQDNIDEKLQKDGCKIIERQVIEYDYVCEVNSNSK